MSTPPGRKAERPIAHLAGFTGIGLEKQDSDDGDGA
jgi:hypothetical protein